MNRLKQKQEQLLDNLNLSDLKRKVNEIVEFCNKVNERLEFLEEDKFTDEVVEKCDFHKHLELEDHNFKVNSKRWRKVKINGEVYLQNPEGDIWEITKGECKGEQLFTFQAMMRETKKAGKRVPTDEEFSKLVKTKDDIKNVKYCGYRDTGGTFDTLGTDAYFWSSTVSGSNAWYRNLYYMYATVGRNEDDQANGFSVRVLKEEQLKEDIGEKLYNQLSAEDKKFIIETEGSIDFGYPVDLIKKCDYHKHLDETTKKLYRKCITLDEVWDMMFSSFPSDMENFDTITEDQAYITLKTLWKKLEKKTYEK